MAFILLDKKSNDDGDGDGEEIGLSGEEIGSTKRFMNSWSVLLFFFKALGYARGFDRWAPLIRMIIKIVQDIRYFLMVVIFILVGFSMAFMALGDSGGGSFYWVYGSTMSGSSVDADVEIAPHHMGRFISYTLILWLLMFMVAVVCMNLLIAIMSSTYEKVDSVSAQEALHEQTKIILDIERFFLPELMKWFKIPFEDMFPRWLHVLLPRHSEGRTIQV